MTEAAPTEYHTLGNDLPKGLKMGQWNIRSICKKKDQLELLLNHS